MDKCNILLLSRQVLLTLITINYKTIRVSFYALGRSSFFNHCLRINNLIFLSVSNCDIYNDFDLIRQTTF